MGQFDLALSPWQVMQDGKTTPEQVDTVILVGGSTGIPKVREIVRTFFKGKKLHLELNPDEAIAYGAAAKAAMKAGTGGAKMQGFAVVDALPLSLGVEVRFQHCLQAPFT